MELLHSDLLRVREKSGLTIPEISKKTRTPESVILEIEKGSIFEKTDKQKTYIRSFVRSYAKAIGIKEEDIIRALDAFEAGTYAGGIRKKYLPETISTPEPSEDGDSDQTSAESAATSPADVASDDEDTGIIKPGPTSTIGHDEFTRPDPSRSHNRSTPPPPKIDTVDWAKYASGLYHYNSNLVLYIVVILLIVALGAGGYYGVMYFMNNQDEPTAPRVSLVETEPTRSPQEVVSPVIDTLEVTAPEIPQSTTAITLPDTLYVVVYAFNERLEPIRITSDANNRRSPYWIEQGEAMRFDFYERIVIEGQLDRLLLVVNDHVLSNLDPLKNNDRILTLTRNYIAEHSEIFTREPEEFPSGYSAPSVIRDRPVF